MLEANISRVPDSTGYHVNLGQVSKVDSDFLLSQGFIITNTPSFDQRLTCQEIPNQETPTPEIPSSESTPESTDIVEQTLNISEINPLPSSVHYGRGLLPEFYREPNVEDYRLQTQEIGSYVMFSRTGTLVDNGENTVKDEFSENVPLGISGILDSIISKPDGTISITILYPSNYLNGQEIILFDQEFSFDLKPEDLDGGVLVNFNDSTPDNFENRDQVLWIGYIKDGVPHTEWLIQPLQKSPNSRSR